MARETELYKDKIEVSLDGRQIFYLFFGGAVIGWPVFDVGVAFSLFDGRPLLTVPTPQGEEERFLSISPIEGKFFAVIWMWRDGTIRIVTARRARDEEEKRYRALYG